jgi:hypothetical protein
MRLSEQSFLSRFRQCITLVAIVGISPVALAEHNQPTLQLAPANVTLLGPVARHRLLPLLQAQQQVVGIASSDITWTSSDESVVTIDGTVLVPQGNGKAVVTATWNQQSARCDVTVQAFTSPHTWNFRNHVQPILARYGCSMGACHGALAGKGGFKLSLRGYDALRDYYWITRQARGRRIELADPGRSLLLAKPTVAIPHKGGLRFDVDSKAYQVLSEWISSGAPAPEEHDPQLRRLEVLPARALLNPKDTCPLLVRAHYSDGRIEDVTDWAKYSTTNETVVKVDDSGGVQVVGYGQGSLTIWFSQQIAVSTITVPYPNEGPDQWHEETPRRNFIDNLVLAKLAELRLPPSPRTSDAEFIRRVFIDTVGLLPTAEEVQDFVDNRAIEKRDRLIDDLLGRDAFVDYWTYKLADLLLVTRRKLTSAAVQTYYDWIHSHVAENTAWDKMVREILTAKGNSLDQGEVNFFSIHRSCELQSENACQAFMGLSIGCAKCHNHPLEKWTNDQYYAMANLFARTRAKGWSHPTEAGDGQRFLVVADTGELLQPNSGKPQPPAPLDAAPLAFNSDKNRREYLADWMTSPDNPYFARAAANRIWANFFQVGIVNPVDDMRLSNPPSNPALLDALARYLIDHEFDTKALMRAILQSETYQRSSLPLEGNKSDQRFFSRYYPRRMMAEVLLDAIAQTTGAPSKFTHIIDFNGTRSEVADYPSGTRATELKDSAVDSYFLDAFGRNDREITCDCERFSSPTMVQVLHLANGNTINEALRAKKNRVEELLNQEIPDAELLDEIYLVALARRPTPGESDKLLSELAHTENTDHRELIEDIFWGVLSSREFLFNH